MPTNYGITLSTYIKFGLNSLFSTDRLSPVYFYLNLNFAMAVVVETHRYFKDSGLYSARSSPRIRKVMEASSQQISRLLSDWSNGNQRALDRLMPVVYDELRRMARNYLRQQPANHSFQTTELIHEAYLKLAKNGDQNWQNKEHFFGVAAKAMRHILVDYARSRQSQKHGGGLRMESLADHMTSSEHQSGQLVALDDALKDLESMDARKAQVVELKFFGGLTNDEVADLMKISTETVKRDWRFARTWLLRELAAVE